MHKFFINAVETSERKGKLYLRQKQNAAYLFAANFPTSSNWMSIEETDETHRSQQACQVTQSHSFARGNWCSTHPNEIYAPKQIKINIKVSTVK
jgi:hypothetical protein